MRTERSTQEMLAAIVEAHRAARQARLRYVNCPDRIAQWCQQDAQWYDAVLENLKRELAMRDDAHEIGTALRFLLAETNTTDDT